MIASTTPNERTSRRAFAPHTRRARHRRCQAAKITPSLNLRILDELVSDGRIAMAELGRRVGLSAPAVAERVQRLERAGVIAGYRAELDPRALGFAVSAVVRIRPAPGQLQRIPEVARETLEVAECH